MAWLESDPIRFGLKGIPGKKFGKFRFGRVVIPKRNVTMSVISEEESSQSSEDTMPSEADIDIDELLRQARALLDDQDQVWKDKQQVADQEDDLYDQILKKIL